MGSTEMLRAVNRLLHRSCIVFLLIYLTLHASSCSLMPDDYDVEFWETVPSQGCEKPEVDENGRPLPGCRDGTGVLVHSIWK
jgi:hypothetical protein